MQKLIIEFSDERLITPSGLSQGMRRQCVA